MMDFTSNKGQKNMRRFADKAISILFKRYINYKIQKYLSLNFEEIVLLDMSASNPYGELAEGIRFLVKKEAVPYLRKMQRQEECARKEAMTIRAYLRSIDENRKAIIAQCDKMKEAARDPRECYGDRWRKNTNH